MNQKFLGAPVKVHKVQRPGQAQEGIPLVLTAAVEDTYCGRYEIHHKAGTRWYGIGTSLLNISYLIPSMNSHAALMVARLKDSMEKRPFIVVQYRMEG